MVATTVLALFLAGCSAVSPAVLRDVDKSVTVPLVQSNPDEYIGRKVLWGGIIIASENLDKTTRVEILSSRLNMSHKPTGKGFGGRFMIEAPGFLDPFVYRPDRGITVVGFVKGVVTRKIGSMEYPYPVVEPVEVTLTDTYEEEYPPYPAYPDYPPMWYPPYDPFYPYPYYPYWPRHPRYPY
ncbi:MAG: Slp family lipoprotein [Thermodesulfobacteriota bacterium]